MLQTLKENKWTFFVEFYMIGIYNYIKLQISHRWHEVFKVLSRGAAMRGAAVSVLLACFRLGDLSLPPPVL